MADNAIGLIETKGYVAALAAGDAMVKAANVTIVGRQEVGDGLVSATSARSRRPPRPAPRPRRTWVSSSRSTSSRARTPSSPGISRSTVTNAAELRVYLLVRDLQPQFAAYLGTPTRARGYPPFAGQHALIVEVAPALAIERVTDLALRAVPAVEPGILFVERQFGVLEVHGRDLEDVRRAGQAILDGLGAAEKDQLRPRILFSDVIEDVTDAHAIIINRNRSGSMIIPGDTLGVSEVTPALFAAVAANEAERAAPGVTLVDVSMIGVAGRIYVSGPAAEVRRAQREIADVISAIAGRDHEEG